MKRVLVPIDAVRSSLGEEAAKQLLAIVDPVPKDIVEGARRYVSDTPGDRVRRLRDRAAFASIMVRLVQQDEELRDRVIAYIDQVASMRRQAAAPKSRGARRPARKAVR